MRVLTWNMDHWKRRVDEREAAWSFLDSQEPTVALLQEASPPMDRSDAVYREGDGRRRWGSAVVAPGLPITALTSVEVTGKSFELHRAHPGGLAIAEVAVPSIGIVTCVSIYGVLEQGWAITTAHRLLSDLAPLLHSRRNDLLVIGGDLNCSTQLPEPWRPYHRNFFERIELFGLIDLLAATASIRPTLDGCPCGDTPCFHVQTQKHARSKVPWHNDYLYATKKLAARLASCDVIEAGDPPWSLSDHRPVVAQFK